MDWKIIFRYDYSTNLCLIKVTYEGFPMRSWKNIINMTYTMYTQVIAYVQPAIHLKKQP